MYDTVLVPTDGSDDAEVAIEHAVGVARRNDATLHAVHATEVGQFSSSLDEETFGQTVDRIREAGENALDRVLESAQAADIETESAVVDGTATDVIVEYVEDNDIDIVVMATRGRTGEEREFIGSVTERVVRTAPAPVLTVNAGM